MWFLLPLFALLWAAPVQATVFFNETFDDGAGAVEGRWSASCGVNWTSTGVFSLDTSQRVSGTTSLKEVVNGLTTRVPEFLAGTCFIDKNIPNAGTIYLRWYERTQSGFIYDTNNVKSINIGATSYYPSWWFGHWGGNLNLEPAGQAIADTNYGNPTYSHNVSSTPTPTDQWVCVETQVTLNTQGQANGIIREWIDGTLVVEYLNRELRGPNDLNGPNLNNSGKMFFNLVRMYAQHGVGTRWYDNWAAADTRIGCSGQPNPQPSDVTSPGAPVGLTVR